MNQRVPAGWYPDSQGNQRYWDGSAWTEHVHRPNAMPPSDAQSTRPGQTRRGFIAIVLALAIVISATGVFAYRDYFWGVRADARAATRALNDGDLGALHKLLVANRGNRDFAYFFTSEATPRALGDALATVAGSSEDEPFKPGVDTHDYELTLTNLAGTLALATHGIGDRALPNRWTSDFIVATTTPEALYGKHGLFESRREKQDSANKGNLLLLLSRGYWSTEFLEALTRAYYEFDRREGDEAWPKADPHDDVGYAPAPNGTYLTDGVLALTAALTANPSASQWAFTDFRPGTTKIADSTYAVGKFTHYLMFEHKFPESDGTSVGMAAALTALSSAIESPYSATEPRNPASTEPRTPAIGPQHDVDVLQALIRDLTKESRCSWSPTDYWSCVLDAAAAVWNWVKRWGHQVLSILALTTFAPPPFNAVGVSAAATNATWYAVEGDYAGAGLSLAAAVPGLAFGEIAKGPTAGKGAVVVVDAAAKRSEVVARVSHQYRRAAMKTRVRIGKSPRPRYNNEREAQNDFAKLIPGARTEERIATPCKGTCTGTRRHVDIFDGTRVACIEVKVGMGSTNFAHERNEIAKDLMLLKNKGCKSIEWRFAPDAQGRVGPHAKLRELLEESAIPIKRYVP